MLELDFEEFDKKIMNDALNDFVNQQSFNSFLESIILFPCMDFQKIKNLLWIQIRNLLCLSFLFEVAY